MLDHMKPTQPRTGLRALERAIDAVGSKAALAKAIGVQRQELHQWLTQDRPVPAHRCPLIEEASNRAALCEELRPDIKWSVLRAQP